MLRTKMAKRWELEIYWELNWSFKISQRMKFLKLKAIDVEFDRKLLKRLSPVKSGKSNNTVLKVDWEPFTFESDYIWKKTFHLIVIFLLSSEYERYWGTVNVWIALFLSHTARNEMSRPLIFPRLKT